MPSSQPPSPVLETPFRPDLPSGPVLITGGAGFIGEHLARRLLADGCAVRVLDNFSPQIHGVDRDLAPDLRRHVELFRADIAERSQLAAALRGCGAVVHLAAETGTGQSMYEVERYARTNLLGTALLLDCLVNAPQRTVERIVVASSRAIYGEGQYRCPQHHTVYPEARTVGDLIVGLFEPRCPACGTFCPPEPTGEAAALRPSSFYGLTKLSQEQMVLLFAQSLGIAGYAMRYQNVFGPGQSLQNPYTGILAIFSGLARAGKAILLFEDGRPTRDFVYIDDVVEATCRALYAPGPTALALNVGSGQSTSVEEVARRIIEFFGSASPLEISGTFRIGDIRHNVADLGLARQALGFVPAWEFAPGLARFLEWAANRPAATDGYARSLRELQARGLMSQ